MSQYDVIIIGAGPAGCSAAWHLTRRERRVLLLDKEHFPRDKVCGDGVAPRAVDLLVEMGLGEKIERFFKIYSVSLSSPAGFLYKTDRVTIKGEAMEGYVIPRRELDHVLLQNTIDAGVETRQGFRVKDLVMESGKIAGIQGEINGVQEEISAPLIIGADGEGSLVRRKLGLGRNGPDHRLMGVRAYYEGVEELKPIMELHYQRFFLPAYGWLLPIGSTRANVGIGFHLAELKRFGRKPADLLNEFISRCPFLAERFRKAEQISPAATSPLSLASEQPWTYGHGFLLAGAAGSFANPFSGEGIYYALATGKMAARVADDAVKSGNFSAQALSSYEQLWRKAFDKNLRACYILQRMIQWPRMVDNTVKLMMKKEQVVSEILELIMGDATRLTAASSFRILLGV